MDQSTTSDGNGQPQLSAHVQPPKTSEIAGDNAGSAKESTEEDTKPHRCETHDCDYEGPAEHSSHVDGKKTHPNPMLHSVTVLEQHVEKLMHHVIKKGESLAHHLHGSGFRASEEDPGAHERNEKLKQTVARLEHKVGDLMHQLHENVKDNEFLIRNGVPRKGNEPIKHDGPSVHDTPVSHDGQSKAPSNQVESDKHDGEVNYPGGIVGSATEPGHHDKHDGEVNYPGGIVGSSDGHSSKEHD